MPWQEIADALGRPFSSVIRFAQRHQIKRPRLQPRPKYPSVVCFETGEVLKGYRSRGGCKCENCELRREGRRAAEKRRYHIRKKRRAILRS